MRERVELAGDDRAASVLPLTAIWTTLGLCRSMIQLTLGAPSASSGRAVLQPVLVAVYWIPVSWAVLWLARARWRRLPAHWRVVAAAVGAGAVILSQPAWAQLVSGALGTAANPYVANVYYCLDTNLLLYAACLAGAWGVVAVRAQADAAVTAAALEARVAELQLHVATMQLQPHFLFNTLHLVSELAMESRRGARRLVRQLRALLVESFRHGTQVVVPLAEELRFLDAYLAIQRERFGKRLHVDVETDPSAMDASIPHLLLQPLVENAIRHGTGRRAAGGRVIVRITRREDSLWIDVEDDGPGVPESLADQRTGIGTSITRHRLSLIYGDRQEFSLLQRPGGGTIARAGFPAHPPAERGARSVGAISQAFASAESSAAAPTATRRRKRAPALVAAALLAAWFGMTALWVGAEALGGHVQHASADGALLLSRFGAVAFGWVLILPLCAGMARWIATRQLGARAAVLSHVAAGFIAAGVQVCAAIIFAAAVYPPAEPLITRWLANWVIWDLSSYATVAIVARSLTLHIGAAARGVEVTRLRTAIAAARRRRRQLQLQPEVMLSALDSLSQLIQIGGERLDEATARVGDVLRAISDGCARDDWRLAEELDAAIAYADICNSVAPRLSLSPQIDANAADAIVPVGLLTSLLVSVGKDAARRRRGSKPVHCWIRATAAGEQLLVTVKTDDRLCAETRLPLLRGQARKTTGARSLEPEYAA